MSANEQIMVPASELVHEYVRLAKIEELEKLKAEIEKEKEPYIRMWETGFDDVSYGKYRAYNKAIEFIVKRIDELKGE